MTSFSYWPSFFCNSRVFPVLADFFSYWPSCFCIGRVCHQYDASHFYDTNTILMKLINNKLFFCANCYKNVDTPVVRVAVLLWSPFICKWFRSSYFDKRLRKKSSYLVYRYPTVFTLFHDIVTQGPWLRG